MDSEIWASLLSATKRQLALHSYRSDRILSHEDGEAHDDLQIEFTCPFCTGEFDIATLCSHIEEEHCFESKAAVCPVCSTKVKNDMIGHITFQHGHLLKMQRKRFHVAITSIGSTLSSIMKERGVVARQLHPSGNNCWPSANAFHAVGDPLANVLFGLPSSQGGGSAKSNGGSSIDIECATNEINSSILCASEKSRKQSEADILRASFIQQLVLSTVFREA